MLPSDHWNKEPTAKSGVICPSTSQIIFNYSVQSLQKARSLWKALTEKKSKSPRDWTTQNPLKCKKNEDSQALHHLSLAPCVWTLLKLYNLCVQSHDLLIQISNIFSLRETLYTSNWEVQTEVPGAVLGSQPHAVLYGLGQSSCKQKRT